MHLERASDPPPTGEGLPLKAAPSPTSDANRRIDPPRLAKSSFCAFTRAQGWAFGVTHLPQWGPQGAEASAGRARARAGRLKADAGRVGLPGAGGCRLSSSRRRSRATSSCNSRMAWL